LKAILLEEVGAPENLQVKEIEKPGIKANEVLVETKAFSINPVDFKVRQVDGVLTFIYGEKRPAIIGWDIAGIVSEVGGDVTKFKTGDEVFGMVNFSGAGDAYAEFVASPEDHLAKKPANITFEEAAATTLAPLTALQILEGKIKEGDKVFIHAGSGGVGHFAIQIAKHYGAHITTTCSAKNKDFVLSVGADEHIDYKTQKFEEVASGMDLVLDAVGGDEIIMNSLKVLKEGGTFISIVTHEYSEEIKKEAEARKVSAENFLVKSSGKDMETLARMLESGAIKAHVSKTFSFNEIAEAHKVLESSRTVGKIVGKV